ncbi:GntR family transcriptional regulator [Pseudomonas putida]|uniref:GntR family transcriptional regulator n=1 Tax=Pseudomonas putida TaxID=303 RepID=UPI00125ECA9A|nr:GntR family transcriptional regulator [Pseudomonas putida]KAB5625418.1 GntR family transcriptional regulator [Pseudomonas putida]
MTSQPTIAAKTSVTQSTYELLRDDLLSCRIRPGERLNIRELSLRLSINAAALREALSRLTADGLVVAEPLKGFRSAPISADDLTDLSKMRVEVENMCIRESLAHGELAWESQLIGAFHLLKRMDSSIGADGSTSSEWREAHHAFHEAIVGACTNSWMLKVRSMLFLQNSRYRNLSISLTNDTRDLEAEHLALLEAALERDVDRTCSLMTQHILATQHAVLLDLMSRGSEPSKR